MGGDDLGEPGADGGGRAAADARRGARGLRALGAPPRRRRRGDGHRPPARALGRRGRRRDPGAAPDRRVPALHRRAGPARRAKYTVCYKARPTRPQLRRPCSSCSARRTSAAASGSSAATTTSSAPGPCGAPASTRPSSACGPGYRGLAVSLDGQSRMGRLWPRTGGQLAVLEAARNVACTGAEPIGLTDCLNFGNPEKGEIAWELAESIEGMAEACEALRRPDRLRQRLALQRDRRARDRPDAGRRLRRPARGRAARAAGLARRRRDPARRRLAGRARRLRVPGPLRRGRRPPGAARPRGRGLARRVPLARRAAVLARPRRLERRPRGLRSPRPRSTPGSAPSWRCRTIRARGSARAAARPCSPARPRWSTCSAACRCGGSASSAARACSGSSSTS